jgi:2-oxo-4-hydroxy-4-carboxy-5-ureidoimidazoline decarboxylase
LNARLQHSPDEELAVVAQQLREIAVLRLEGVLNS